MIKKGESPDQEDRRLLLDMARGDHRALATLYERYAAQAFGVALKVCGNRTLAEDVVQEALLAIWRRPNSYDPERGTVASYLFGAVHNKAVDAIRHEESLRRREQAVTDQPDETPSEDVVEAAWLAVRRTNVRTAVSRLSGVQRDAIQLAYFEGLTYSEVAEKLGIPLGTAKTRIRDGMIRLRNLLSESGVTD
ncbi:MAG: sigma-70 family RNA polymerase sigma factor [Actinomycetota bacterium]